MQLSPSCLSMIMKQHTIAFFSNNLILLCMCTCMVMYYGHYYIVLYYAIVACVYNSIHSCISAQHYQLIPIY